MPVCTIRTNLNSSEIPKDFHLEMNKQLSRILNKPIQRCVTMIHPDIYMAGGDSTSKAAVVLIQSFEVFTPDTNPKFAIPFRDFLNKSLNLTDDSTNIPLIVRVSSPVLTVLMASDVVVRRAESGDYRGVLAIGEDIYRGRDVLPFLYSSYITDTDKMCFVMLKQGEVVAFVVLRNFDGGESYEAVAARTKHSVRGKLLMMYMGEEIKKQITSSQFITAQHKQRFVVMNLETPTQDMIVQGYRTTIQVAWKASIMDIKSSISLLQKLHPYDQKTPLFHLSLDELRMIFQNPNKYSDLSLPDRILIVENQTYQLGYPDNANLILKHGLTDVYATKSSARATSLSFCTPVPSGSAMDVLRVGIEYYGPEKIGTIIQHFEKHFTDIPANLKKYPWVEAISVHLFIPKSLCTNSVLDHLKELVSSELKLNAWQLNDQAYGLIDHDEEVRAKAAVARQKKAKQHKSSL